MVWSCSYEEIDGGGGDHVYVMLAVEDGEMRRHVTSETCLRLLGSELGSLLRRHYDNMLLMTKDFT